MNNIGPNNTQNSAAQQKGNANSLRNTLTFSKGGAKPQPGQGTDAVKNAGVVPAAGNVNLSSQALDLNALEQSIKQSPDINATRMVNLHARVSSGEYKIDADRLAQRILDFEAEIDR